MTTVWNWFNGNKTVIGMALLWLADKTWFGGYVGVVGVDIAQYLGGMLTTIGIAHKVYKADTSPEPTA